MKEERPYIILMGFFKIVIVKRAKDGKPRGMSALR